MSPAAPIVQLRPGESSSGLETEYSTYIHIYVYETMYASKSFGELASAVCYTIYAIYISLCTHIADPNPFKANHIKIKLRSYVLYTAFILILIKTMYTL